jgi:hypothetical protein
MAPFALPYSAMLPRQGEVDNLLVSVAVSASHVAFNALRMEPIWMVLGQVLQHSTRSRADDQLVRYKLFYFHLECTRM